MKQLKRANILLVELMIVILFFALSVGVLIKMISGANRLSDTASAETRALAIAQNIADELKAAEDKPSYLLANGFILSGDSYITSFEECTLTVNVTDAGKTDVGTLTECTLSVEYGGKTLFTLDCTQYGR